MPPNQSLPMGKALPWLLFITGVFFLNYVARSIFSPLMVTIEHEMGFTHARAGRFFLDVAAGYSVVLLLSGFVSSRIHHRRVIALMPLAMGVLLLALAACRSLPLFEILLVLFGMCGGLYLPSGVSAITSLVQPRNLGKALAIHELAPNLSLIAAPLLAQAFLAIADWRMALTALGIASLVMGLLFARFGRGGEFSSEPPSFRRARDLMRKPVFWALTVLFTMAIAGSVAPYSVLPLYLVSEHGMSPDNANRLLALSRLSAPLVALIAGWTADRMGKRRTVIASMAATGVATVLIGATSGPMLTASVLLQPVFSVCYFPAGFAILSLHFPAQVRSMAVSLIIPMAILGGFGLAPALLGFLGDKGDFGAGFVIVGLAIAASTLVLPLLTSPEPRAETDL